MGKVINYLYILSISLGYHIIRRKFDFIRSYGQARYRGNLYLVLCVSTVFFFRYIILLWFIIFSAFCWIDGFSIYQLLLGSTVTVTSTDLLQLAFSIFSSPWCFKFIRFLIMDLLCI